VSWWITAAALAVGTMIGRLTARARYGPTQRPGTHRDWIDWGAGQW
jgi:uncharacterized membrane-anchored protein YhcB (DUF1043 family)